VVAQQVEDRIRATCTGLADFPRVGAPTDVEDVRRISLVRYAYTIYYRIVPSDDAVDILRMVPAAMIKDLGHLPQ
jgi:plasmid stabilization system protein ParE